MDPVKVEALKVVDDYIDRLADFIESPLPPLAEGEALMGMGVTVVNLMTKCQRAIQGCGERAAKLDMEALRLRRIVSSHPPPTPEDFRKNLLLRLQLLAKLATTLASRQALLREQMALYKAFMKKKGY